METVKQTPDATLPPHPPPPLIHVLPFPFFQTRFSRAGARPHDCYTFIDSSSAHLKSERAINHKPRQHVE